jgi:hypothetical protein
VSTLNEEDEDEASWQQTIRPVGPLEPNLARSRTHSRDSSAENPSHPPSALSSSRVTANFSRGGIGSGGERVHNRQTSIVHGIHHSRNASLASSISSPLSPQFISPVGTGVERSDLQSVASRLESESGQSLRPAALGDATISKSGGFAMEKRVSAGDSAGYNATQRRVDAGQGTGRREHSNHPSHSSRHHKDEQKTVGEYALHVLFTSVSACGPVAVWCVTDKD